MPSFAFLDLAHGDLPPWLNKMIALARPAFTAGIVAIPSVGAAVVGTIAIWWPENAMQSVTASIAFLKGIPDAAYGMVTAIALGYTAGKSIEAVKANPPVGSKSPEAGPNPKPVLVEDGVPPAAPDLPTPAFGQSTDELPDYAK